VTKTVLEILIAVICITLTSCALKASSSQNQSHPNCVSVTRQVNKLFCDGKPYMEVSFLHRPTDKAIVGISVYDFANEKEQWIYPSQGWKLAGDCCIELANGDAMPIKKIAAVWLGTVSASYPLSGECYNIHYTENNSGLLFTTQSLVTPNPVWEYSYRSGKTRKVGRAPKRQ
jgi:hypothetical protein